MLLVTTKQTVDQANISHAPCNDKANGGSSQLIYHAPCNDKVNGRSYEFNLHPRSADEEHGRTTNSSTMLLVTTRNKVIQQLVRIAPVPTKFLVDW